MQSSNAAVKEQNSPLLTLEGQISRMDGDLTYEEFFRDCLSTNRPVLLSRALVSTWPAFDLWTTSYTGHNSGDAIGSIIDAQNAPARNRLINWKYLVDNYGNQEVSVSDCNIRDSFGNLRCTIDTFAHVVELWQRGEGQDLYVKDWHLVREVEAQGTDLGLSNATSPRFYTTPDIFRDDWMNAYYSSHTSDDFRFVYIGASGTFTPLHRDVYCSYSWSTNVCGRKRWWLFPPEQTGLLFLKDRSITVHDVRAVDENKFPGYSKATPIVVDQEEGETIFVPSGWYHQVENLTDCISINHNWCNSVNLPLLYESMCEKVIEVEDALEDVREIMKSPRSSVPDDDIAWKREFTAVVQDVVKQDAGWNWLTFWSMIVHVLESYTKEAAIDDSKTIPSTLGCGNLFPLPPDTLRPPIPFILQNIQRCHDDFVRRDRMECEGEVLSVVQTVVKLLDLACLSLC